VSRPRFLADEDLNDAIVDGVLRREPAAEFRRVRGEGLAGRSDPEVLEFAAAHGLIVVSHDQNTMTGHASDRLRAGLPMPGLFVAPQTAPVGPVIDDLVAIWSASEAEEWEGLVRYLPL
jgi:hypothetical protein